MASHNKLRSYLVSPAELNSALKLNASKLSHEPRIIPLCASWFLPNDGRNGYETFVAQHIPHSISVPITDLLDPKDKTFLPASELKAVFESKGIKADVPIISSCGTGVTAAIIDAALTEAGYPTQQRRLYDGSWTEWAQRVKPGERLIHKTE
jgi:3-mercaptopyruvate sulfurtransferase SseA